MTTRGDERNADPTARERRARDAVTTLIRVADTVRRSLERTFGPFGLTGQQYNVLRILRGAGEPLPTMEVAGRMLDKTPAVTGLLDRLEAKGLVTRARSERDRRVWLCSITDEGLRLLGEMDAPVRRANKEAVRGASDAELETLVSVLERIERAHADDG